MDTAIKVVVACGIAAVLFAVSAIVVIGSVEGFPSWQEVLAADSQ